MMRNKGLLAVLIALMLILSGCKEQAASDKVQVYASFYAMGSFASVIAGNRAEVHTLVPSGAEPHDYEPTTNDMRRLLAADVFIYNGSGMESFSADFINTISSGSAVIVEASDGIPTVIDNADPHIWLDADNAIYQMGKIKDALIEADAENAAYYEANYEQCLEKAARLNELCDNFNGDGRRVIVTHPAYAYLFNRLGLEQVTIETGAAGTEPPPSRISEIVNIMAEDKISTVFYEEYGSSKLADAVASAAGAKTAALNSFENGDTETDYFEAMEENIAALAVQ